MAGGFSQPFSPVLAGKLAASGKLTDFVDMETSDEIQIDPRFVRQDYMQQIRDFIAACKRECAGASIEYVQTHTGVPFHLMHSFPAKRKRLH